jgi:hypothetical protein
MYPVDDRQRIQPGHHPGAPDASVANKSGTFSAFAS